MAPQIRIAIIGGGPGGLGAAITLSALPFVSVTLYEQATELREIGAGIRIGFNCWKVLGLLGAAKNVKGHVKTEVLHRNGLSGELVSKNPPSPFPKEYGALRVRRTRLQRSLIDVVPKGIIQLQKRLTSIEDLGDAGVHLKFEDGITDVVDLVIGADGIRSVVREHVFPSHSIQYTGTTIWRVLIPLHEASLIPDVTKSTTWWHGPTGHVYLSPVDDVNEVPEKERLFEIAARRVEDPKFATGKKFSWGVPATNQRVESHFTTYDSRVRETLALVPEGQWKEFSAFAGARLDKLSAWDGKVVLVGDASHPLSGAFGSGAAFALEDGWILARALEYAFTSPKFTSQTQASKIKEGVTIFDGLRSPYYSRMYKHLDEQKAKAIANREANPSQSFEESLQVRVGAFGGEDNLRWIYGNDIEKIWKEFLAREKGDIES